MINQHIWASNIMSIFKSATRNVQLLERIFGGAPNKNFNYVVEGDRWCYSHAVWRRLQFTAPGYSLKWDELVILPCNNNNKKNVLYFNQKKAHSISTINNHVYLNHTTCKCSIKYWHEVYAGSKLCLSLDMCTAFAKPCEYARRWQMSRWRSWNTHMPI